MDADTRHQLRQNELAEVLARLRNFGDKRITGWLTAIVVVALGYAGYRFWQWRQDARLVQSYQALASVDATDASLGDAPLARLRELIADGSQPGLVAISRLQLAQGLEARGQGSGETAKEKLDRAEAQYKVILDTVDAPDAIKAPAMYRLALLYETKRDFELARQTYAALSEDRRFVGSPFGDLALMRLELLEDLSTPVEFEPGVKPLAEIPQPASQPASPPAISDAVGDALQTPAAPATQPTPSQETGDQAPETELGEPAQP